MESLYDNGKIRALGVSNFSSKKLADLLKIARVPPVVNQVECHPSWQQTKLREFCKSNGVHIAVSHKQNQFSIIYFHSFLSFYDVFLLNIQGYSPLGSPGTKWLKSTVLTNPILISVAEKLGKTPAQVALRWGLQMGHSVLPKSTNETRIEENLAVFDWAIPDDLFAELSKIEQVRFIFLFR